MLLHCTRECFSLIAAQVMHCRLLDPDHAGPEEALPKKNDTAARSWQRSQSTACASNARLSSRRAALTDLNVVVVDMGLPAPPLCTKQVDMQTLAKVLKAFSRRCQAGGGSRRFGAAIQSYVQHGGKLPEGMALAGAGAGAGVDVAARDPRDSPARVRPYKFLLMVCHTSSSQRRSW